MSTEKRTWTYTAYILRCWLERSAWRYSLEEIGAGRRHGFATLDEFFSFLLARPDDGRLDSSEVQEESGDRIILEEER